MLGSAVFVGFVVVVVVNMGAVLMKGVVMLGGLAAEPVGGVAIVGVLLVLGGGGGIVRASGKCGRLHGGG